MYLVLGVIIIGLYLSYETTENEEIDATTPLWSIEYSQGENSVTLHQSLNSSTRDIFNFTIFQDLDPRMTNDEAEAIIGKPDDSKWRWDFFYSHIYFGEENKWIHNGMQVRWNPF